MSRETIRDLAKPLTSKDLDERISQLASDLFAAMSEDEEWAPVPIDTADFVRRMQPFIVYN